MDVIVDSRVDYYFVNSELIQRRLWHYLKRDSVILYPSIDVSKYRSAESEDYILHMGRFDVEKQIMPVVKACEMLNTKLVLTGGKGTDKATYEYVLKKNGKLIDYRGFVSEKEKIDLLAHCKAVVYNPLNEDFGIIPLEALASGKPVIVNFTGFPPLLISSTGVVEEKNEMVICRGGDNNKLKRNRTCKSNLSFRQC
jgi:Glycosyltransferase